MIRFASNLLLALAWALLHADLSFTSLAAGFVVGFAALVLAERAVGQSRYAKVAASVVALAWGFLRELWVSSLMLARDILRARTVFHPAFVRLDVSGLGGAETLLVANLISLTPGTITVDAEEGAALYIHSLYARDPEDLRRRLGALVELVRRALGREAPRRVRE